FLVESVHGIETIKASAVEPQFERRWEEQLAGYVKASFATANLSNVANQVAAFVNKVTTVLILWIGARLVMSGSITVGQLVAFNMLAARVSGPILRLVQLWQDFQQAGVSVQRLGDVLNTPAEPRLSTGRAPLPAIRGAVSFEHVSFRYRPDYPEVLQDVHLAIPAGEVVGIVGPSGSGKSTLAKLVQRLHVPERGRVLIDGVDVALVEPSWLRRQIGVVAQESFLFNRTVRDNIALADPALGMARIVRAAEAAGAHDFILGLPEGYDTLLGEHGSNLSGGQRQRLAIARALVTDPRILILDEATSALDYESERIVQDNLGRIAAGRTVLLIAHRLSTVRNADRIVVLEAGRLVEQGTPDALIAGGGHFARLWRYQTASAGRA
ncbi:MAG: ATP-binding cassette domain-containing protein, partial [Pseudomonadota bacterium]|nr:ATP-binding cassette domain-containing protein [Pseudomonadota bacterium]